MNELYENVYQSRPPVIDGLLYPGTYLFAGAPKVGKSFLMAQLAYHVSMGLPLWDYPVHKGTVLYLALEGHLGGCRIGFDAGGSDRKVSAVIDGEVKTQKKTILSLENVNSEKYSSWPKRCPC